MRALLTFVAGLTAVALQAQGQAPAYNRADRVRIRTAEGKPASPEVQTVIAVPGDRLEIDESRATVNGQTLDLSAKVLATCGKWAQDVPAGHYVLVGEEVKHRSAARSCSLLPASRIVGLVKQ